jgi:hypothetical protein
MKMSGFEPLENLRSAKATRALLLLSIFLFSAGPGLAAGVLPTIVKPTIESNHLAPTTAGAPFGHGNPAPTTAGKPTIEELFKKYSNDSAPTKGIYIDRDLQSQGKDQDSFIHEETVQHGMPLDSNNNRNNNCESSSDELAQLNGNYLDDLACKNRTIFHAPGIWGGSGSCCKKTRRFGSGSGS